MAPREREVTLHVYDFRAVGERASRWLSTVSLGIHHTGVEVGGYEYSFNDAGVFRTRPKACSVGDDAPCVLKESVVIGRHAGSANDINGDLNVVRAAFRPGTYSLVQKNCNHFSEALCLQLCGERVPPILNRAAALGAFFGAGSRGYQVHGEALDDDPAAAPPAATKSWLLFGSTASAASAPADNDDPRTKKKQLTDEQKAALAKLRQKT